MAAPLQIRQPPGDLRNGEIRGIIASGSSVHGTIGRSDGVTARRMRPFPAQGRDGPSRERGGLDCYVE